MIEIFYVYVEKEKEWPVYLGFRIKNMGLKWEEDNRYIIRFVDWMPFYNCNIANVKLYYTEEEWRSKWKKMRIWSENYKEIYEKKKEIENKHEDIKEMEKILKYLVFDLEIRGELKKKKWLL